MFEDLHRPLSAAGFKGAVKWIVVISGVLLILQLFWGPLLVHLFGLTPVDVMQHGRVWELFTYGWLHGGFFHWLLNMYIVWAIGKELESRWGTAGFVRYCLVTLLGGAAGVLLLSPHSMMPTIGSSSVVFGLLVAFAVVYPEATMYLFMVIPVKAWQAALFFGFFALYAALGVSGDPISALAHLGGMVSGYLYLRYAGRWSGPFNRWSERWQESRERRRRMRQAYAPGVELYEITDDVAKEVDRILDKVSKEGAESLTKCEKELMTKYSQLRH